MRRLHTMHAINELYSNFQDGISIDIGFLDVLLYYVIVSTQLGFSHLIILVFGKRLLLCQLAAVSVVDGVTLHLVALCQLSIDHGKGFQRQVHLSHSLEISKALCRGF